MLTFKCDQYVTHDIIIYLLYVYGIYLIYQINLDVENN